MPIIKLNSGPQEIFMIMANREAEVEFAKSSYFPKDLPKYTKPKVEKGKAGWLNFTINTLKQLTP